jgi:hypothetical protein
MVLRFTQYERGMREVGMDTVIFSNTPTRYITGDCGFEECRETCEGLIVPEERGKD